MNSLEELKNILIKHYKKYPSIQIQDMVKLIYQNEFAGGHIVTNEEESLKRIDEEYRQIDRYSITHEKLYQNYIEDIGNGLSRLYLYVLSSSCLSSQTFNRFFVNTSKNRTGSIAGFEKKLNVYRQCCIDRDFPYDVKDYDTYISDYRNKGYMPVSHSEIYRRAYKPAYRVVENSYCFYIELFSRIDQLLKQQNQVIVALEGNSGAGKSSLAHLIDGIYDCNIFHMDDYFLRPEQRTRQRLNQPGGNVDYERFKEEVINGINSGKGFLYRAYDCQKGCLGEIKRVCPKRLNIIEGSYSMHPTLIDKYNLKVFLKTDEETQRDRILRRNGPIMLRRFIDEWIPLENKYFDELKISEQCELIYNIRD